MSEPSAFQQGKDAYQDGLDLDDNPYTTDSPEGDDWEQGWYEAETEESEDMDE